MACLLEAEGRFGDFCGIGTTSASGEEREVMEELGWEALLVGDSSAEGGDSAAACRILSFSKYLLAS